MASIDKTYTDSYQDYLDLQQWAKGIVLSFPTGQKRELSNYIYDHWTKEDFDKERPVMNTPTYADIFIIQNCPFQFVQDCMEGVYGSMYNEYKQCSFPPDIPKDFKQNRKISIQQDSVLPLKNKGFCSDNRWLLFCNDLDFSFDDKYNKWVLRELFPNNTNCSHHRTVKAVIRHLRKQYLPSGLTFTLSGRRRGEKYTLMLK